MELKFKRDTAFRKTFFVPDSFAHPAKMDAQLLIWIVENYTSQGEVILDPMAGSGTTMLACGLGRDVILVELEEKFCKMMRDNWGEVKMRPQLGYSMGRCQIIQGDARQLENILCDKIITSPPFAEAHNAKGLGVGDNDRADLRAYSYLKTGTEGQIGDLPYGEVDKIVTSPPYTTDLKKDRDWMEKHYEGIGRNPKGTTVDQYAYELDQNNISNLPYGQIDKIVTSPPYAETLQGSGADAARDRIAKGKYKGLRPDVWISKGNIAGSTFGDGYSRNPNNIGSLLYGNIDSIITSPPYENNPGTPSLGSVNKDNWGKQGGDIVKRRGLVKGYDGIEDNIGNLKSDSYLEAMLQVYQQCYKVLKPEGLMILVTKNFIRNKQVIRLDEDTIKLCEQAGFNFFERHSRKLPSQSFWRVIYHQKHPEVEQILNEDVLVFVK